MNITGERRVTIGQREGLLHASNGQVLLHNHTHNTHTHTHTHTYTHTHTLIHTHTQGRQCLESYGGHRGVGIFLWARYPCSCIVYLAHTLLTNITGERRVTIGERESLVRASNGQVLRDQHQRFLGRHLLLFRVRPAGLLAVHFRFLLGCYLQILAVNLRCSFGCLLTMPSLLVT